jgi:hypothetical protein
MTNLYFEFRRRLPADVVYKYEPEPTENVWKRTDLDLWIKFVPKIGWACINENNEVLSIPWLIPPDEQGNRPPEGKWVSCKGDKSYVYDLVYTGDG